MFIRRLVQGVSGVRITAAPAQVNRWSLRWKPSLPSILPLPGTADHEKSSGRNTVGEALDEGGGAGGPPVVSQATSPRRAAARARRRSADMAREYASPYGYAKGAAQIQCDERLRPLRLTPGGAKRRRGLRSFRRRTTV